MTKTDRCVVRNAANRRGNLGDRYRHNERHNQSYGNGDIDPSRSPLNVHYKECGGSYAEVFDRLVADGVVSMRGLGKDPKIVDEMVFDVNTDYFDRHGGYEYAREFFAEAYKLAVKEAGGEQYVLSAVMHADERNRALSEKLGRDVYYYHLHVTYVPVVEKKIYLKKNNKDPEKAGKPKETVIQVSHSKKWPREMQYDEHGEVIRNKEGKAVLVNSYSLLQDRFHEHMRVVGFTDFERGERGSTAQHLDTLAYKIQQDEARAAEKGAEIAALNEQAGAKQKRLAVLDKKLAVGEKAAATLEQLKDLGQNTTLGGKVALAVKDWKLVYSLAKECLQNRGTLRDLTVKIERLTRENADMKARLEQYGEGVGITDTMQYFRAKSRAPRRIAEVIEAIMRQPPEQTAPARSHKQEKTGPEH